MEKVAIYEEGTIKIKLFRSYSIDEGVEVCVVDEDGCVMTTICNISVRGMNLFDMRDTSRTNESFECDAEGRIKILD